MVTSLPSMSTDPSHPPKPGKFKRWRKTRSKTQNQISQGTDIGAGQPPTAIHRDSASENSFGDTQTKWVKIWLRKLQRRKPNVSQSPPASLDSLPTTPPALRIITLAEQLQQAQSEELFGSQTGVRPLLLLTNGLMGRRVPRFTF